LVLSKQKYWSNTRTKNKFRPFIFFLLLSRKRKEIHPDEEEAVRTVQQKINVGRAGNGLQVQKAVLRKAPAV
jgi:hypothetical protein